MHVKSSVILCFIVLLCAPVMAQAFDGKFVFGLRGGGQLLRDVADDNRDDYSYVGMAHLGYDLPVISSLPGFPPLPIDVFVGVEGWGGYADSQITPKLRRDIKYGSGVRYGANARVGFATAVTKLYALGGYYEAESEIEGSAAAKALYTDDKFKQTGWQIGGGGMLKIFPYLRLQIEFRYTEAEGDVSTTEAARKADTELRPKYNIESELYDAMIGLAFEF